MERRDSLNFDRVAALYDDTRGGERRGEQLATDLARHLRNDQFVLEVGVGTGVISRALKGLGFAAFGVDISEHMLARARERIGPRVVQGDAMALPFRSRSLNQAISVWVLHVVADPIAVMVEVARALRPGGTYLVMDGKATDDAADPVAAAYREIVAGLGVARRSGRVHDYAQLAPQTGLRVVDIVTTGPYRYEASIADTLRNFETRSHSWMWNVPDEQWERVAVPVIERLRRRPDVDEMTERQDWQEILVLTR